MAEAKDDKHLPGNGKTLAAAIGDAAKKARVETRAKKLYEVVRVQVEVGNPKVTDYRVLLAPTDEPLT